MGQPFIGEIRMFGGNFAPAGWAFCDGSLQPISENETLFQLIGTTYGGDGQSTFALPNLLGRIPMHKGNTHPTIGELGGTEDVTLNTTQLPVHNHVPVCNTNSGTLSDPTNAFWAEAGTGDQEYSQPPGTVAMNANAILPTGGGQPHSNMAPFLVLNFIISLFGIFPSQ